MLTAQAKELQSKGVLRNMEYRNGKVSVEVYLDCKCADGFLHLDKFKRGININHQNAAKISQKFNVKATELKEYKSHTCRAVENGTISCPYGISCPYCEVIRDEAASIIPKDNRYYIYEDALEELNQMIGLEIVKNEINSWASLLQIFRVRNQHGLPNQAISLNTQFIGNAGTGKTTVARIMRDILFGLGFIDKRLLIETERADLVSGHVGGTAIKTKEVLEKAKGGLLFIDEAYSLARGEYFGRECIDTLVKNMEDNRESTVCIFAGYKNEMLDFLRTNPGLASRINKTIEFDDYSHSELLDILEADLIRRGYELSTAAKANLLGTCTELMNQEHFGNARTMRNLADSIVQKQAQRLANRDGNIAELNRADLQQIIIDDVL